MHDNWLRPAVVLVSGAALVAAISTKVGAPWRAILALEFVLVCPGVSMVAVLGLRDRLVEWAVVAPLSLTIVTLTSVILFYGGLWSPDGEFGVLLGLCLVGLAWSHRRSHADVKGDT
jgi:hypothetical protein